MPDLSKTAPEQRGMPELLAAPAPCGPRPADRNLHTIRSEVKMPCLRAGRANGHAQSGSELCAILPIPKRTFSYHPRPGSRPGVAGARALRDDRAPPQPASTLGRWGLKDRRVPESAAYSTSSSHPLLIPLACTMENTSCNGLTKRPSL